MADPFGLAMAMFCENEGSPLPCVWTLPLFFGSEIARYKSSGPTYCC